MTSKDRRSIEPDQVRALLREAGHPLTRRRLSDMLGLDKEQSDARLKPVLNDLIARGEVVRNRRAAYGLAADMDLVRGRISAHSDGFGFVIPDDGSEDLYLSPKQMRQVFHGDQVLAAVTGVDRRGRREGGIVEVVERAHRQVVGRLLLESGVAVVVPDDPRLTQDILIPLERVGEATPGQIVVARIEKPPTRERAPVGEIIRVLGHADEPGMATDIAIFGHGLPDEFPDPVLAQAKAYGDRIDPEIAGRRKDLRDLPLVTIDGADARDFDDAVFAEPSRQGFRLIVAIADVAEYVHPGDALDTEAKLRGTSVYFPDRVLPMLPEALSNGLCSLRPDEDRLCTVCDMQLDEKGKVRSSRFYEGVMRSQARLTYDQVQQMMVGGDAALRERFAHALPSLDALYEVYRLLSKRRQRRGALDFESSDVYFQFDAEGKVEDIRPRHRHDAHRLIEECMILANVEAARFVGSAGLPMLYRVHAPPPADKLESLEEFLRGQGLPVSWSDHPEPSQIAAIQARVAGSDNEHLVNAVLLRSLSLAVYQPENEGHFGLALKNYAHFTSPIRRYPDLLLHRAIKHLCRKLDPSRFGYSHSGMVELGRHCSWTERRAEDASRDVDERLKCQFMQRHIGDEFNGIVTGVTSFGLFVELPEFGVSGLVHVTAMPNDYYNFDPISHSLLGKRHGRRFSLADRVRVSVAQVNIDERKIDLSLAESSR
ncbi:ribonuclease R [Wenzhouxiangella marina]|uniref:Ribonuclease R n=1 Tax=Wenzhouxiangella marina TaxID=1579979 RepID=A0A0K0XWE9_9GAMM|nr:ribonuclease R [Wenzhouxiangella marina]AKS42029.1 Ribonuclease R [Wenzhouxiangella marina]MBB6086203.1 ribonuclease R [Wenzhouxiangella marina]